VVGLLLLGLIAGIVVVLRAGAAADEKAWLSEDEDVAAVVDEAIDEA
jgi:F0F1-type ATP synthase assembly protein I